MRVGEIALILGIGFAGGWILRAKAGALKSWFKALFGGQTQVAEIIVPEPVIPEEIEEKPDYGNITPVLKEPTDPDTFGPAIHEFPGEDMKAPVTRFEDFNRRLFILRMAPAKKPPKRTYDEELDDDAIDGEAGDDGDDLWPRTLTNDFATRLEGFDEATLLEQVRKRLRPRYNVIIDHYGYWARASAELEQTPDYTDPFVATYLAIPESERPVVLSVATFNDNGYFRFIRYGFEDFLIRTFPLRFFVPECLTLIMASMRSRTDWLWFSVARMRKTVWEAARFRISK